MPLYAYTCPTCGEFDTFHHGNHAPCPNCGERAKRRWAVNTGIVVHEYWNYSLGKPISSNKQFDAEMRATADRLSERRGCTVNLERADPNGPGVTDEGLRETHDANVKRGIAEPAPRIF